jgi:hypothetical protein
METDAMAMGRRKREQQGELFLATQDLAVPMGHVFYDRLNRLLAEGGFDDFVEVLCEPHYETSGPGRPSIPPGTYFRMLFIGYFEAWAASVALPALSRQPVATCVFGRRTQRSDTRPLDVVADARPTAAGSARQGV